MIKKVEFTGRRVAMEDRELSDTWQKFQTELSHKLCGNMRVLGIHKMQKRRLNKYLVVKCHLVHQSPIA